VLETYVNETIRRGGLDATVCSSLYKSWPAGSGRGTRRADWLRLANERPVEAYVCGVRSRDGPLVSSSWAEYGASIKRFLRPLNSSLRGDSCRFGLIGTPGAVP